MNRTFRKLAGACWLALAAGCVYAQDFKPTVRFAVIADRTGGEQKGIFEQTLKQAETLSPDFMIGIGDMIEGYTSDKEYLNEMWEEFEGFKSRIQVPFYSVPGNHDCTNAMMSEEWLKRWGYLYKHMYVDGNMFWLLNTEENGDLSAEQIAYFKNTLKDFPQDKWIYIFMHRPLWKENRTNGYTELKKALGDRKNVVVFSGHEHYYLKNTIDGIDHYIVATSGGGNSLRSNKLGEFHHFFFVTVTDNGPRISNVLYDGIIPDDIVNEQNEEVVKALRSNHWIKVAPAFLQTGREDSAVMHIEANSRFKDTLTVEMTFTAPDSLHFASQTVVRKIVPGKNSFTQMLYNPHRLDMVNHSPVRFNLKLKSEKEGIATEFTQQWLLEKQHTCTDAENWVNSYPYYVDEDWDWSGPADGLVDFSLSQQGKYLVLKYRVTDDSVNTLPDPQAVQDKLFVELLSGKKADRYHRLIVAGGRVYTEDYRPAGIRLTEQDGVTTLLIPKSKYGIKERFYFNLGFLDHDDVRNLDPSVIWWRPVLKDNSLPQFGEFHIR